jgi:hypothetical protein
VEGRRKDRRDVRRAARECEQERKG